MASFILTLVGPDRLGLVSTLSAQVAAAGGSWLESRMARLAGQFAGIVRVDIPAAAVTRLHEAAEAWEAEGFRVVVRDADAPPETAAPLRAELDLVGQDRPGIVRDLTQALAALGVNIEELTTNVESASFSGETMFRAVARLGIPAPLGIDDVRLGLERLGNEMMVDLRQAAVS